MKKKKLNCPVAGKEIKPATCGINRISNYDCPNSCPHNPWSTANYIKVLEIYDRYRDKLYSRMQSEGIPKPPECYNEEDLYKVVVWFRDKLFIKKDSNGLTLKQRWEKDKYAGLNNDQKILLNAEEAMRPALLEIQQIHDDYTFTAIDLLRPEEGSFLMADYSMAASACRFSVIFALMFDLPHYRRINTSGADFSFVSGMSPADAFNELARHLGAPADHQQMLQWLSSHVAEVFRSIQETADARSIATRNNIDAIYIYSIYTLNCTQDELTEILDSRAEMVPEDLSDEKIDEGFIDAWEILEDDFETKVQQKIIGTLFLHDDNYIKLEVLTQNKKNPLKPKIEKLLGKKIKFKMETKEDFKNPAKTLKTSYNPELVSPALLKDLPQFEICSHRINNSRLPPSSKPLEEQLMEQHTRDFLDHKIPVLNNKTPRQAAKTPKLRPRLIQTMKMHARNIDRHNLENGTNTEINWALEELGLDEIIFPPPPPRNIQPNTHSNEAESEDYADNFMPPMSNEDIKGITKIIDETYTREERIKQFKASFQAFCNTIDLLCENFGNPELTSTILDTASYAAFLMIPPDSDIGEEICDPDIFHNNTENAAGIFTEDSKYRNVLFSQPNIAIMIVDKLTNDIPETDEEITEIVRKAIILTIALSETIYEAIARILD